MEAFFASGRAIDLVLALLALETAGLLALRRWRGVGPRPGAVLAFAASGAALMLALRAALTGAAWPAIALWLCVAFIAHGLDLALRWPRSGRD